MISSAYDYYISQYGLRTNPKYDTHSKSQLKNSYSRVLKANSLAPTYKIDTSTAAQRYAIDLKENARELSYIAKDLSDASNGEMVFKKSAQSNNPAVSAEFIGDSSAPAAPAMEIAVKQIATHQVNTSNFLQPNGKLVKPGTHAFDLDINNVTYEFEFNVSDEETTEDIQKKLARLINRSNIGLHSQVLHDSLGNSALEITSDATGINGIKPTLFNISSEESGVVDTLGLDRVTEYPGNAIYSINGEERSSQTNDLVINKTFALTLKDTTGDTPAIVSLNNDGNSIADSINDLISGYNKLVSVATDTANNTFSGNERLRREFISIANAHRRSLASSGLNVEDDGTVSVDRSKIMQAASQGTLSGVFSELNDFKKAMQRKAENIATNPMDYVNNKIVAYKNPHRHFTDPYNLSAYSGMMFNDYI